MCASRRKRRTEGRLAALSHLWNGRNIGASPPHARIFDTEVSIFSHRSSRKSHLGGKLRSSQSPRRVVFDSFEPALGTVTIAAPESLKLTRGAPARRVDRGAGALYRAASFGRSTP